MINGEPNLTISAWPPELLVRDRHILNSRPDDAVLGDDATQLDCRARAHSPRPTVANLSYADPASRGDLAAAIISQISPQARPRRNPGSVAGAAPALTGTP
jgi:hypothetical protein